jgi:hypothetical protein
MLRIEHVAPAAALALFLGCTDPAKMPADAAIQGAESALAAVRTEAAKYVPDKLNAFEDGLAKAKEQFGKGDFKAALETAKDLPAKAQALGAAVAAKKDELTKTFNEVGSKLPQLLQAIKSRVDILSAARKLPAGMDPAKLQSVKDGLTSVTQGWADASAKMQAGALVEAAAAAKQLQAKAVEVAGLLGLAQ